MSFETLNLDPLVVDAVTAAGYVSPTPIQEQAIPCAMEGRDILGVAQTGTGKTASFVLPMISLLAKGRARARMPRSLILCPTRELAAQVQESFTTYGKNHKLTTALLIGGVSFADQDRRIDRGVDVLIATPGRLLDHFERGKLMLTGVQILVVDEADRMLDMGFIPDIERIFNLTPFTRQTLFFSATMPAEIQRLTSEFLSNPVQVEVAPPASTAETVTQTLCMLRPAERQKADRLKRDCLRQLIRDAGDELTNAIIFCNRKRDVSILYKSLSKHGLNVGALHGDLDQRIRMQVLDGFRAGEIDLLVASDVAARGLDIPNVSHVFNFDVPIHSEDYVHRIGRTGRAGREGVAFTLCLPADGKHIAKIEEMVNAEIPRREMTVAETRSSKDHQTPEMADSAAEPESTAKRASKPATDSSGGEKRRPQRGGRNRQDKSERHSTPRGRRYREEPDTPVIGLGDHVPAFLLREIPLPRRRADTAGAGQDAA